MKIQEAARVLGLKADEVAGVEETPVGPVITVAGSGARYVVVPDDQPDAEGKTGLMFAEKPDPKRVYTFPVYAPHPAEPDVVVDELGEGGDSVPDGKVADVVDWVRGGPEDEEPTDGWPERAAQALAVETAKDKPRSSLVELLTELVVVDELGEGGDSDA